ncbi:MAE_28990/MAE_18760 family HEPN-like nuclease [Corynebacterium lehmanniae]
MSAIDLRSFYLERYSEVETYLDLLKGLEDETRHGVPRLAKTGTTISPQQTKILTSNLYLQLYNLVEATVTRCLQAITAEIQVQGIAPIELSLELRREWTRAVARTHEELGPEKRLKAALKLSDQLVDQLAVAKFEIDPGGGGNWDDKAIEELFSRLGAEPIFSADAKTSVKRHVRDDLGSLALVKNRRNGLAHGSLSFVECGGEMQYDDMESLTLAIGNYLDEVVESFVDFIAGDLTAKVC